MTRTTSPVLSIKAYDKDDVSMHNDAHLIVVPHRLHSFFHCDWSDERWPIVTLHFVSLLQTHKRNEQHVACTVCRRTPDPDRSEAEVSEHRFF